MISFSPSVLGFFHDGVAERPADAVDVSDERYAALMAGQAHGQRIVAGSGGAPELVDALPVPPTTWAPGVVQRHLDNVAQRVGYDSIASAVSYAGEPAVPRYQLEGQALRAWRSLVWHAAHAWLDANPSTTQDQLLAALPAAPEL